MSSISNELYQQKTEIDCFRFWLLYMKKKANPMIAKRMEK
jgi:hypothetical protein